MKAGLLTLVALAATANAQVRREVHHRHQHRHLHKRDIVYETSVKVVTAYAPNAIVYVDQNGKPVSTAFNDAQPAASTPAPAAPSSSSVPVYEAPAVPESSSTPPAAPAYTPPATTSTPPAAPAYTPPATTSTPPAAPAYTPPASSASPQPQAPSYGGSGRGVAYAPYTADGNCKSTDEVASDFSKFDGFSIVRTYGTDCNQVPNVLAAAKTMGMKVFLGIFDINQVQAETQTIIDAMNGNWDIVDTVSVGNELVNNGTPAESVIAALGTARGMLKAAGYTGNVVTVDTFVAIIANPSLCEASDYAAANAHAFFDSNVDAAGAGDFVKEQAQRVSTACGGKRTVITESGWPWQGETNGMAVPSRENQQTALASLKSKFSEDIFLFSAYDDMWKKDWTGSFGCEKFWGFLS